MIVVDDCSKDDSVSKIQAAAQSDERIKLIALEQNVGAAAARNVALKQAKGRYIAFLDSDDLWHREKLEKQLSFMKAEGHAFTFTTYQPFSEDGETLYSTIQAPTSISYRQYLRNTIIGCLTVIIDRKQTGDFLMPDIRSSHDMALWLLIMKRGFVAYGLEENLASYRLVSTSNTAKKWKAAKEVWAVYREVEKLNPVYSACCFMGYAYNAIKKRLG
jgi:teichuronic acid biosynthesis glycosyltransferase TuaG